MNYTELVESGAKQAEILTFLAGGETVPVTIRIPRHFRNSAKEAAAFAVSATALSCACA